MARPRGADSPRRCSDRKELFTTALGLLTYDKFPSLKMKF